MMQLNTRYQKLALHVGINLFLIFLLTLGLELSTWNAPEKSSFFRNFLQATSGFVVVLLPPIYITVYGLIPHFLIKKRYFYFALGMATLIALWGLVATYVEPWMDEHWFQETPEIKDIGQGIVAIAFFLAIAILINLSYRWFMQLSRMKQMENDRLQYELSLLKNQINPHFFFNTLNNLYALSLEQSTKTPKVILKLSEMMRYALYDCKETHVSISNEVHYLENYIALQQIRHGHEKQITFTKNIGNASLKVAPMLMIVFLENAFKHGVEVLLEKAFVKIDLEVTDHQLSFKIENNYQTVANDVQGGLGLENVKRRLALLYQDKHQLIIQDDGNIFQVHLTIDIV